MKRLAIFLVLAIALLGSVDAQGYVKECKSTYNLSTDTATNTGDIWLGISYVSSAYQNLKKDYFLSIQPVLANLTGTTAGNVFIQGSVDGTNWVTQNSGNSDLYAANDTLTAVDAASTIWTLRIKYPMYRIFYDGTGTHTSTIAADYFLLRPEN